MEQQKPVLNWNISAQFRPQTLNLIKNDQQFMIYITTYTESRTQLYTVNFVYGEHKIKAIF